MAFSRSEFSLKSGHASGSNGYHQEWILSTADVYTGTVDQSDYFALVGDSANNASGTGELIAGDLIHAYTGQGGTTQYALLIVTEDGTGGAVTTAAKIANATY